MPQNGTPFKFEEIYIQSDLNEPKIKPSEAAWNRQLSQLMHILFVCWPWRSALYYGTQNSNNAAALQGLCSMCISTKLESRYFIVVTQCVSDNISSAWEDSNWRTALYHDFKRTLLTAAWQSFTKAALDAS